MVDLFLPPLAVTSVNSIYIALFSMVWLYLGYRWYSRVIDRKLIEPRDDAETPAVRVNDGLDYQPARPLVLFGHHFSSIAGAGPIIGPIFACALFGWGPTLLWVLVGSVFFGAVHDYTSLMISVRNDGKSIPEIARKAVNPQARILFMVFVWVALVIVITAFAGATRNTFTGKPEIVLPTFALIPLAVLFGFAVYRLKLNLGLCTAIAFCALVGLLFLGTKIPITLTTLGPAYKGDAGPAWFTIQAGLSAGVADNVWFILLLIYGLIASVLPVWLLLQPRDYISAWLLFLGIVLGAVGIFGANQPMDAPVATAFQTKGGPVWPVLFILVACGAISGFHAVVSGGTSSKQLAHERQGRLIGFGSMIVEGVLAVIALVAVSAGLKYGNPQTAGTLGALMAKGGGGPIVAFAKGLGALTEWFMGPFGVIFGMVLVNAFVMTTLDTCVRLTRFIGTELLGDHVKIMKNRVFASFVAVGFAFLLNVTGGFAAIWPIFGASNQLLAALTLVVVTAYFVKHGKPRLYTLIPAVFMTLTTLAALAYNAYHCLGRPDPSQAHWKALTLGVASVLLFILGLAVVGLAWKAVMAPGPSQPEPEPLEAEALETAQARPPLSNG